MKYIAALFILSCLLPAHGFSETFDHHHTAWTRLLQDHVTMENNDQASRVDYKGVKDDMPRLTAYLSDLSGVSRDSFKAWNRNQQLAFLINAYNAFTVQLIVDHYPVVSIRDITRFFRGPWSIDFISLFGEKVSLDHIEHKMIRKKGLYDEPRIHMAVVCASIGCPPLIDMAYTPKKLDAQLETNVIRFLSDRTRNRYNPEKNRIELSKIFDWYGDDFERIYGSVEGFIARYAGYIADDPVHVSQISRKALDISFLDYDWRLNDIH